MAQNPSSGGPQKLGALTGHLSPLKWIRAWKMCAGPVLEKQAQFMGFRNSEVGRTLLIEVKDPLWRQELEFQKAGILKEYHKALEQLEVPEREWPKMLEILANARSVTPRQAFSAQKSRKK